MKAANVLFVFFIAIFIGSVSTSADPAGDSVTVTIENFVYDEYVIDTGKLTIETLFETHRLGFCFSGDTLRVFHGTEVPKKIGKVEVISVSKKKKGISLSFSDYKEINDLMRKSDYHKFSAAGSFYYDNVPREKPWAQFRIGVKEGVYYYRDEVKSRIPALVDRYKGERASFLQKVKQ